jgi:hypothetical protein
MFASIRRYAGDTALADQLVEHEDEVRSLISGVRGFRAYYLVRGEDATASITICDDRMGTDESNRIAAEWLRENLPNAAKKAPQITAGDVVIHGVMAGSRA